MIFFVNNWSMMCFEKSWISEQLSQLRWSPLEMPPPLQTFTIAFQSIFWFVNHNKQSGKDTQNFLNFSWNLNKIWSRLDLICQHQWHISVLLPNVLRFSWTQMKYKVAWRNSVNTKDTSPKQLQDVSGKTQVRYKLSWTNSGCRRGPTIHGSQTPCSHNFSAPEIAR